MILRPSSLKDHLVLPDDPVFSRRGAPGRRPLEFLLNPFRFGGGGGGGADPYFSNVALLMGFDDATLWTDDSPRPKVVTPTGAMSLTSTQKVFGAGSAECLSGSLTSPSDADFACPNAFTFDCWMYIITGGSGLQGLFNIGAYDNGILIRINGNAFISMFINNTEYNWPYSFSNDTWYQVSVTRSASDVCNAYVNKSLIAGSPNISGAIAANGITIAQSAHNGGEYIYGNLDEIRLTQGVERDPTLYDITQPWPRS